MSYKGIEMTSQENYIFSDIKPYNPEFNIEELKIIQSKLEDYTSGRSSRGISANEAEIFLDWVTFNARNYAVRNTPESPMTASMTGQCAPTQMINVKLLSKMNLDVRAFNMADCIGEVPMTNEDLIRMQNGWSSTALKHSVSLVNIPIIDNYGKTEIYKFQLDPTFRQFCEKENCIYDKFIDKGVEEHKYVAPHPGYFMIADNLKRLGVSNEIAQKSEKLCKYIIQKGYFLLNEENAKLYGDAFARSSRRLQFQQLPIGMSGKDYIRNFDNIPMKIFERISEQDNDYTILPLEMKGSKNGIFSRVFNFFNKFRKRPLALPEGNAINNSSSVGRLSGEELRRFREGEKQVLASYHSEKEIHSEIENEQETQI